MLREADFLSTDGLIIPCVLSPLDFFALLLDNGLERRRQNSMTYRLAISGCNPPKTHSLFDFNAVSGVSRSFITDLATCAFIQRHVNVFF